MPRHATVKAGTIVGIVNHDGAKDHPYGDVEFLGPLPDDIGVEWVGKSAKSLQEELDKGKPMLGGLKNAIRDTMVEVKPAGGSAAEEALTPSEHEPQFTTKKLAIPASEMKPGSKIIDLDNITPAELLKYDKAGNIKYFTFVSTAKRILGKDYPESEEKGDIVKALEKKAG